MKYIIALFMIATSISIYSEDKLDIHCEYNFGTKSIHVKDVNGTVSRVLSSAGKEYIVGIKNTNDLNELDDYIVIEEKDKRITYSLDCKKSKDTEINNGLIFN